MLTVILDSSSQKNLISSSIVHELGITVKDNTNPYELSGQN